MKYISLLFMFACLPIALVAAEKPAEAVNALIDLYEKKDFDKLIRERYTEIHKAKTEEDKKKLIEKFKQRYSDAKKLQQVVDFYKLAKKATAKISTEKNTQISETDR